MSEGILEQTPLDSKGQMYLISTFHYFKIEQKLFYDT